jgi:hypothetical protein
MVDSPDMEAAEDLRDVFKLMYEDEDDWEVEEVRVSHHQNPWLLTIG